MANETLSLSIQSRVQGQSEADRLDQTLTRIGTSADRAAKSSAQFAQQQSSNAAATNAHAAALQIAQKTLEELIVVAGIATKVYIEHRGTAELLTNTYRGLRLVLSPTLFTASTLGVGLLAEETLKLTYHTAELAQKQALLSATSKVSFADVQSLAIASNLAGKESGHYLGIVTDLQKRLGDTKSAKAAKEAMRDLGIETEDAFGSTRNAGELVTELGRKFSGLVDPVEKAEAAVAIFGSASAGKALESVNAQFSTSIEHAQEFGATLSREEATNLSVFKTKVDGIGVAFRELKSEALGFADVLETRVAAAVAGFFADFDKAKKTGLIPNFDERNKVESTAPKGPTNAISGGQGLPSDAEFSNDANRAALSLLGRNRVNPASTFRTLGLTDSASTVGTGPTRSSATARAVEQANAALNAQAKTEDGRNDRLADAIKRRETLTDQFLKAQDSVRENPGDLTKEATLTFVSKQITAQIQLVKSLEAQKKATEDIAVADKQVAQVQDRALKDGLDAVQLLTVERIQAINELSKRVSGPEFTKRAAAINTSFDDLQAKAGLAAVQKQEQVIQDFNFAATKSRGERNDRLLELLYGAPLKEQGEILKQNIAAQRAELDIALNAQRSEIVARSNRTIRISELGAQTPGQEVTAVRAGFAERIRLANELYSLDVQRAAQELDVVKRRTDFARAEADLSKQVSDARLDAEVRLAELQHQRITKLRDEAGSVFDSITAKNGSLTDFITGELRIQGRTIFQNLSVEFGKNATGKLALPGQGTPENPNLLGRALSGTVFGMDPLKTATDLNTSATIANTAALIKVSTTAALGGSGILGTALSSGGTFGGGAQGNGIFTALPSNLSNLVQQNASLVSGFSPQQSLPSVPSTRLSDLVQQNAQFATGLSASSTSDSSNSSNVLKGVGTAAGVAAGVFGAVNGFRRGGAQGISQGIGSVLGTAALLDPEPISKAVLAVGALASGLIGAAFGDPKKKRDEAISKTLEQAKYVEPQTLDFAFSDQGTYADVNRFGQTRSSAFSNFPANVRQSAQYKYDGQNVDVPGQQFAPFDPKQGGQVGTNVNITIQALDSKSIMDIHPQLTEAVRYGISQGQAEPLMQEIRGGVRRDA